MRIDDRLHLDVAAGVGEESTDLAEGDGSYSFEAGSAADDAGFAVSERPQRFLAEMDVQHHPGSQLAQIESGRPHDQPAANRFRLVTVS